MDGQFDPNTHFVDFYKYCKKCKYWDLKEEDYPCRECLIYPVNEEGSRKPLKFKEKE